MSNLELLDSIHLAEGAHSDRSNGLCAMEAAAYIAGEPHSDHPECVCPVLAAYLRALNDCLDDEKRQRIKPYIPRTIGTAGDGLSDRRAWLALDWLIREYTPSFLELAGLTESGTALRNCVEIKAADTLAAVMPVSTIARDKASAAWDAAWAAACDAARAAASDAAWAAAWDAPRDAASDAAWAAAWTAAWAAARAAASDAAWAAASDAAWEAAWAAARAAASDAAWTAAWEAAWAAARAAASDAAWTAAWAAAWAAARAAAWAAVRDAARDAAWAAASQVLAPTVARLQDSSFALLDRMIRPDASGTNSVQGVSGPPDVE